MNKTRGLGEIKVSSRFGNVAIIASRWNEVVTKRLVEGASKTLLSAGVAEEAIDLYWVSGSYELSQAASRLAKTKKYRAIVPLGCLIRGETVHFDVIARMVAVALDAVGRETGVAVSFGVLTVDTLEQALARSGGDQGNKGEDAARAAVELALLTEKE